MSAMSNQSFSMKGVRKVGTNSSEGLSPSRCPIERQGGPSRHCTTAKEGTSRKWSQEVNSIAMECYYNSNQEVVDGENVHDLERKRNV